MSGDARGRLAAYIDELDRLTRRPGEPPLREQLAAAARAELAELDRPESIRGGSGSVMECDR